MSNTILCSACNGHGYGGQFGADECQECGGNGLINDKLTYDQLYLFEDDTGDFDFETVFRQDPPDVEIPFVTYVPKERLDAAHALLREALKYIPEVCVGMRQRIAALIGEADD